MERRPASTSTMDIFLDKWLFAYWQIGKRYFFMATVMFILFYVIFKTPMMGRRIQKKFPQKGDYYRDIFFSLISIGIFAAVSIFTFMTLKPYTKETTNSESPVKFQHLPQLHYS